MSEATTAFSAIRFPDRNNVNNMAQCTRGFQNMSAVLKRMGFDKLRKGQDAVITSIMCNRDTLCVLPTATGKCFKPGTKIRMADNSVKCVEDVIVGDLVMGPNWRPRRVSHVHSGLDARYEVVQEVGESYTVNSAHTLTLRIMGSGMVECGGRKHNCVKPADVSVLDYLKASPEFRERARGWRIDMEMLDDWRPHPIQVKSVGAGRYYGFEVEGSDSYFMLADRTVVHNSACFTIPTLTLDWRTLVFVPLVALMRDQVQSLWRKGISEAGCLSSLQSDGENVEVARAWMSGKLRFLFVAPERLRNPWFQQAMKAVQPDMVAVDEAHCLSDHSDDFRPDYCKIGDYIRDHPPKVITAFSATVDDEAESDIRRVLCMNNAVKVTHMPRRKNLILSSSDLSHDNDVVDFLEEHIKDNESFVVYCSTVKHVEEFTIFLQANLHREIGMYHGKLTPAQKRSMQDEFMKDRVPGVVATNAFGMGVDKAGIRAVVYRDMPGNLGELSQGQGRAGRDGNISHCHTFFDDKGLSTQRWFLMTKFPSESAVRSVFLALQRLKKPNGIVQAGYEDIAKVAQGHAAQIGAALQNLRAAAVIESSKPESRNHRIKFLDESPKQQDLRFEEYKHVITQIGVEDNNTGCLLVDAETLAERINVGDQTIRNNLRKYQSAGYLYFEPPYLGSDIKIIGGIERVEFGRLKEKQAAAEKKLQMVLDYNHIPDDQKHSFLEKYFGITELTEE